MSLETHSFEYHAIYQLLYKLRLKGLLTTEDMADIMDKAKDEMKAEREVLE